MVTLSKRDALQAAVHNMAQHGVSHLNEHHFTA